MTQARTNAVGMTARDLADHAAKLCRQAARHPSIAHELWAEAMACDAEIASLAWRGFASMPREMRQRAGARGGIRSTAFGQGHAFTREEARFGGQRCAELHPSDSWYMSQLGKRAGARRSSEYMRKLARDGWAKRKAAKAQLVTHEVSVPTPVQAPPKDAPPFAPGQMPTIPLPRPRPTPPTMPNIETTAQSQQV